MKFLNKNFFRPFIASTVATLCSTVIGCMLGYPSVAIPNLNSQHRHFKMDQFQQSWFTSLSPLSCCFGAFFGGLTADMFGRKASLLFSSLPHLIGWIVIATSVNIQMMYIGRTICGFCAGLTLSIISVYISEISPPHNRGSLISFHELQINIGVLLMYIFGTFLVWSWLAIVCAGIISLMACLILIVPESPRWLVIHNQKEDALTAIQWLRGKNYNATNELIEIEESIKTGNPTTWLEIFKPPLLKYFLLSQSLSLLQEFSGIVAIRSYTVTIFQAAQTNMYPNLETIIVGITLVLGSVLFTIFVEKCERQFFLIISSIIMGLSLTGMGTFLTVQSINSKFANSYLFWLPLLSLGTACIGYVIGIGPMPYIVTNEVFPNRVRGKASSFSIFTINLGSFIISKCFVYINIAIGESGSFFLFAGFCFIGLFIGIFFMPKTKNKTLESIQIELSLR